MRMNGVAEDSSDSNYQLTSDNDQRVYCVPLRWWKDAQDSTSLKSDERRGTLYTAEPASSYAGPMKLINNIFNSDLVFNLRRERDSQQNNEQSGVGVSGRDFALVPGDMWLQALKWHSDAKVVAKGGKGFSATEDDMSYVYPILLRLSVLGETNSLGVKISKKDNAVELFRRACKIFSVDADKLRIWDFSGQTNLLLQDDTNVFAKDWQRQSDQEILLELQIYGLSDSMICKEGKTEDILFQQCNGKISSGALLTNGDAGNTSFSLGINTSGFWGKSEEAGSLGLTGLQNLGNTCFMNSALQCLAHTPKLVDYFLGDYCREINRDNPLGMEGEIALAFGDLLRKLWAPGATTVAPRTFKAKLARFAPQFSGFNQHDSQELLAFLLDGLHEDLNRVKNKPYVEAKDGDGRPDTEVADEYWQNHLARNDSIIVDVCQGQYKSTLVCPICKMVSATFDPFMYLSLPLPSTTTRTMTITVMTTDGSAQPSFYTISVPKYGKFEDLRKALTKACSLTDDETLLVSEIYNNRIIRYLEDPADSLSLIRDEDQLVVYRLRRGLEESPLVIFMHQKMEQQPNDKLTPGWKAFGIPLVSRLHNVHNGSDLQRLYLKLLNPFQLPGWVVADDASEMRTGELIKPNNADLHGDNSNSESRGPNSLICDELQMYLTDDRGNFIDSKIEMNEPLGRLGTSKRLNVLVRWSGKQIELYDSHLLSSLPEIFKSGLLTKRPQESVSLYKCLEAFLTEEPLGPEDMWYCPGCKEHRQAVKKLDLWRLPEILVIHLKRFSYSRFLKNKLETYIEFPLNDLDLSPYITHKNGDLSYRFALYAISNHYGSMGGGHYTAFIHHGGDQWYDFDDSHVRPISMERIKSSAAYVLFYRRT